VKQGHAGGHGWRRPMTSRSKGRERWSYEYIEPGPFNYAFA
jgi:hypothetical protein